MSPYTSFLVLENDAAYKHYRVERVEHARREETGDLPAPSRPRWREGEAIDKDAIDAVDVKALGVNKALSSDVLGAGALKNIFADEEGFDAAMNVTMSSEGGELVVGRGAGGMGVRGTGKGGGGEGFGRIGGLGRVDTGGGKGKGNKIGRRGRDRWRAEMTIVDLASAQGVIHADTSKNVRGIIDLRATSMRYCYEKTDPVSTPLRRGHCDRRVHDRRGRRDPIGLDLLHDSG